MAISESLADFVKEYKKILIFGAGGGGDSIGSLHIYYRIKELGGEPLLGSIVWERSVVDPIPGPIPLEAMIDVEPISWSAALATGKSYALRPFGEVKPQLIRVASRLREKVLVIDASKGAEGIKEALNSAKDVLGIRAAIAVDVGGDILARGCEKELWSPLADALSLAGLTSSNLPSLVAVHAPGADGELSTENILRYISLIGSSGGLLGVTGLQKSDVKILQDILKEAVTEASAVPIHAFLGYSGEKKIRSKTRTILISPIQLVTFLLETKKVFVFSEIAKEVIGTKGIGEAKRRLNARCVYTELDLENDISNMKALGRNTSILETREQGRLSLKRRGCKPIDCI